MVGGLAVSATPLAPTSTVSWPMSLMNCVSYGWSTVTFTPCAVGGMGPPFVTGARTRSTPSTVAGAATYSALHVHGSTELAVACVGVDRREHRAPGRRPLT